mgnify:CR=1 FL=1
MHTFYVSCNVSFPTKIFHVCKETSRRLSSFETVESSVIDDNTSRRYISLCSRLSFFLLVSLYIIGSVQRVASDKIVN